ncbi:MAG: ATP-binding protein [Hyphomicrobiales bacterium]|nr:ATP-binding protein [Hyphomicrobiales bacterium]MBV8661807.1 ATP-binding protein [Hyphomicrobiales bacterium]
MSAIGTLERALDWLAALVDASIRLHFGSECEVEDIRQIAPPALGDEASPFAALTARLSLDFDELLVLCLALAPHLKPQLLDPFLVKNPLTDRIFTEFGGVYDPSHNGFRPTLQTAAFILAGGDLARRFALQRILDGGHVFHREAVLRLDVVSPTSPAATILDVDPICLARLTGGLRKPLVAASFPARPIATDLEWDDLVLNAAALEEIEAIRAWLEHRDALLKVPQLARTVGRGYRSLFYGPPGTGKTATAGLIGKLTGFPVYRIDLSSVVSKWVGETEKNLGVIFDLAETRDWILFFDEADALFGRRSAAVSANDRYANQEVSYLLQRIEDYSGLVILATNLKSNLDEAFTRRFQSMVYFGMPGPSERARLWSKNLPASFAGDARLDVEALAAEFELTGGAIVNVVHYALLLTLRRGDRILAVDDLRRGIRRELQKSGRTV